jgi:hypothetical protein
MEAKKAERGKNPYRWDERDPERFIARKALLERALSMCRPDNGGGVLLLLGTRGMGKSMFLARLQKELGKERDLDVILFERRPRASHAPSLTGDKILDALLKGLLAGVRKHLGGPTEGGDVSEHDARRRDSSIDRLKDLAQQDSPYPLLEAYLDDMSSRIERLILLYDELDGYADDGRVAADFFNALEDARQKLKGRLVVVAAGSMDMLSLKTVFGSTIYTRATRKILEPFHDAELQELAREFGQEGAGPALSDEVMATLRVLSGGNVALATYGLQSLWNIEEPSPLHLKQAFDRFADDQPDFRASIHRAVFEFHDSEIPVRVWQRLRQTGGRLARTELEDIRRQEQVKGAVPSRDILDMLRASGFIRMDDSGWNDDPIVAEIIPSILSFDAWMSRPSLATLAEQLRADLLEAMADIHRWTPAFYDTGTKQRKKKKLPESAFAVGLAMSLGGRGWKAELEPTSGAGYADIKARYPTRFGEEWAIVEVKIWPRNVDNIHDQVTSYFTRGVTALATVVIADLRDDGWKDEYQRRCLTGKVDGTPTWRAIEAPPEGYFEASWGSRVVEHFLLRLPSRL